MTNSADIITQVYQSIKTPYEDLPCGIFADRAAKSDRTGTDTRSVFGYQLYFGLSEGSPLTAIKKVYLKPITYGLLWFLRSDSNIRWFQDRGVTIWDKWVDDDGDLGPVYGVQWRSWSTPDGHHIDQVAQALEILKSNPDSRRNIVSAWNVPEISNTALPPRRLLFQSHVTSGKLGCQFYQHSADMLLGASLNIASYTLLTHTMAQQAGLGVSEPIRIGGDCYTYDNRTEQCELQVSHEPRPYPVLKFREADSTFDYVYEDIEVIGYDPHLLAHSQVAV